MLYLLIALLCLAPTEAPAATSPKKNGRVLIYEDSFDPVPDGRERIICSEETVIPNGNQTVIMRHKLSQRTFIENRQTNNVITPMAPPPAPIPPKAPTFTEQVKETVSDYLFNPFAIAAAACAGYLLYYMKSKFSLYTLGKACIEKAVWSLWKNKSTGADLDAQDTDTELLIHILHAYNTDNYTAAIAQFLQDVEEETELLTAYIEEAKSTQESMLRFLFEDLSGQIKEAQERLNVLAQVKKTVMGWLKKATPLEETLSF